MRFIHNGVILGIQWMILVGAGSLWATSTTTSNSSFHYSSSLTEMLTKTNNNNHPVHIHPVSVGMMMLLLLFFCHRKGKKNRKPKKKKPANNSLTIFSKKIEKSPKKEVESFINK
jgi:hypothetical protein